MIAPAGKVNIASKSSANTASPIIHPVRVGRGGGLVVWLAARFSQHLRIKRRAAFGASWIGKPSQIVTAFQAQAQLPASAAVLQGGKKLTVCQRAEVLGYEKEYMKSPKDKMIHNEEVRTQ